MSKGYNWLNIVQELQSISQTGLAFTKDPFDIERYNKLNDISSKILAGLSNLEDSDVNIDFKNQKGYATPKIDIRGAILQDNKILLVQETEDAKWCLPGGWADVGESPSEAVKREVLEETGFKVNVKKVIGVYDANKDGRELSLYHAYKIIFLCEIKEGKIKTSQEIISVKFFSQDNIPKLSISRTHQRHLNDVFDFQNSEKESTRFD